MHPALRFTIADLETLPERLDDTRYEVIDGELFVSTQPHWEHQYACARLLAALLAWSDRTGLGEASLAPGVIVSPEDAVAPDLVWVSYERLAQGLGEDGKLHIAPELVVEVLSPGATNERRDREAKLKLYALKGVDEYWIVDWRARTVEVHRRDGGILQKLATLTDADTLTSPLLPGFSHPVASLWRPTRR